MNLDISDKDERRLKLRVAIKLMVLFAFLIFLYVALSSLGSGTDEAAAVPTKKVDISQFSAGDAEFLIWEGRPVVVYRRFDHEISALEQPNFFLADPESKKSKQPADMNTVHRSADKAWFVAIALGTDLGCSIELLPASSELYQGQPWGGGFVDTCRKSRFDFAGRVYRSEYSGRNLVIPPYSVEGETVVLGR